MKRLVASLNLFLKEKRRLIIGLPKPDSINSIWGKFQGAYKLRTGKTLTITDEPEALPPDKFQQSPEVLRSQEPDSLSPSYFVEDRLSRLVRNAIEKDEITMSRGAEILRLDLEAMREIVSSWV